MGSVPTHKVSFAGFIIYCNFKLHKGYGSTFEIFLTDWLTKGKNRTPPPSTNVIGVVKSDF